MRMSMFGLATLAAVLVLSLDGPENKMRRNLVSGGDGVTPVLEIKLGIGRWFVQTTLVQVSSDDKSALALFTTTGVATGPARVNHSRALIEPVGNERRDGSPPDSSGPWQ